MHLGQESQYQQSPTRLASIQKTPVPEIDNYLGPRLPARKNLQKYAHLDDSSLKIIEMAQQRLNLSARAYHRVLRVARTIADLAESELISSQHLTEALSYRGNS